MQTKNDRDIRAIKMTVPVHRLCSMESCFGGFRRDPIPLFQSTLNYIFIVPSLLRRIKIYLLKLLYCGSYSITIENLHKDELRDASGKQAPKGRDSNV